MDGKDDFLAQHGITPELFQTEADDQRALTPEARRALKQLARRSGRSAGLSPLTYNLTISHRHRFVWFRVAKVATRTMLNHFAKNDVPLDVHHAFRMRYPTALFDDYYRFAFVRHPLGRFISCWRDKVVDNNYFGFDDRTLAGMQQIERFAEWAGQCDLTDLSGGDTHLAPQSRLIDLSQIDFLGRLETFDDDFAGVCRAVGVPASDVTVLNQSGARPEHANAASAELTTAVNELYRKDFQIFGY